MLLRNLLLAIGIAATLAGVVLLGLWLRQPTAAPTPVVQTTREILVAAHPIVTGTLIASDDLAWKEVPESSAPLGSIARGLGNESELLGSVVEHNIAAAEPVLISDVVRPTDRGFLSAVLQPGYRAISIAVDAPQSASGLLRPGDHVDIILTQNLGEMSPTPAYRSVAETVLSDLRIVAVDQSLKPTGSAGSGPAPLTSADVRVPRTITLEVGQRDAEKLYLAVQLGKVEIAVRSLEATQGQEDEAQIPPPAWAADVSPALNAIGAGPKTIPAGSTPVGDRVAHFAIMHGAKIEAR